MTGSTWGRRRPFTVWAAAATATVAGMAGMAAVSGCAAPPGAPAASEPAETAPVARLAGGGLSDSEHTAASSASSESSEACVTALADAGQEGLTEVAQVPDAHGAVTLWAAARRWAVCDVAEGAAARVVAAGSRTHLEPAAFTLLSTSVDGGQRYVAAGPLPWPVDEVRYRFPDGEDALAVLVRPEAAEPTGAGWWVLSRTVSEGPLGEPAADPEDPLLVGVTGEAAEAYRIPWPAAVQQG